jgi:hypothetical protein
MKKQFREEAQKEAKKEADRRIEQERLRLQKEVEQERLKIRRSSLVSFIHGRFPDLTDFAQQQAERFDQPAALDLLIQQVAAASDANMVRLLLNPSAAE